MIIKLQMPIKLEGNYSDDEVPMALVYNRDRSICQMLPCSEEITDLMNGELKKFFHAHISQSGKNLIIDGESEWMDW